MSFFSRNRDALAQRGIDPARLPPGQYSTERFPVLHVGSAPKYRDLSAWSLRVFGLVDRPLELSWSDLLALPAVELTVDIHCVTKWSKFDTVWKGVPFAVIAEMAGVSPDAQFLLQHAEQGYTTNVPLAELTGDHVALLAYEFDGKALDADHGYPVRFFVPHLYFWKSAKWLRGLEFLAADQPGFWERNGYHNLGDPFREQRFTDD